MSERAERREYDPHDFYDHVDTYEQLLELNLPYEELIHGLEALGLRTLEVPRGELSGLIREAQANGQLPRLRDFFEYREQSLEAFAMAPLAIFGSFIELKYLGNQQSPDLDRIDDNVDNIDMERIEDWYTTTTRLVQSFDNVHGDACMDQNGDHAGLIPSCEQSPICPHKFLYKTLITPALNRTFRSPEDDREFSAELVMTKLSVAETRGMITSEEAATLYSEYFQAYRAYYASDA